MTLRLAARAVQGNSELLPRRLLHATEPITCKQLLKTMLLQDNIECKAQPERIYAYTDVTETDEFKIELNMSDKMKDIVEMGYNFIVFVMNTPSNKEKYVCQCGVQFSSHNTYKNHTKNCSEWERMTSLDITSQKSFPLSAGVALTPGRSTAATGDTHEDTSEEINTYSPISEKKNCKNHADKVKPSARGLNETKEPPPSMTKSRKRKHGSREEPPITERCMFLRVVEKRPNPTIEEKSDDTVRLEEVIENEVTQFKSAPNNHARKPTNLMYPLAMPGIRMAGKKKTESQCLESEYCEVDMILLHCGKALEADGLHFLIRWKGADSSEDCWLPYNECRDLKALEDYRALCPELMSIV